MREQLAATSQPPIRRAARAMYHTLLALWFAFGKTRLSRVVNLFRRKAPWPGHEVSWHSVEEMAEALPKLVQWTPDPLGGAFDTFYNREIIAARFRKEGLLQKDCDGLALFAAYHLESLLPPPRRIYLVTVVLDPFTFARQPLAYAAHVICVFRYRGAWRVISNDTLYPETYESFAEAVQYNPYCAAHPVLWFEVRDIHLKRLFSGRRLRDFTG